MTGQELVFCICCNNHIPCKHEREHHCQAHNPLTTSTPHKRPRLAFNATRTPHDKHIHTPHNKDRLEAMPTTSKALEHQDVLTANTGLGPDILSIDFEAPSPATSNGESNYHLDGSGQEDAEQLLITCVSQRWHQGYNHSHPHSEPDEDSDGFEPGGNSKTSNIPLEDELSSGDSDRDLDIIDRDVLDQQSGWTIRDELGEDCEAKYAKIGEKLDKGDRTIC
ncbi:hypothetical protein EI94DRAFT_1808713 [Lactarius quietus]|nr:hypothetical protein EI94DRAFT_1808713 [Lactarius quietus]